MWWEFMWIGGISGQALEAEGFELLRVPFFVRGKV